MRLELGARQGSFAVAPRTLHLVFHGSAPPRAVLLDARALPERITQPGFVAREGRVDVFLGDDGRAHAVELDPAP